MGNNSNNIAFGFNQTVQTTGINKDDFVNTLKNKGIDENVAESIFNKFNTNKIGDSQDCLDQNEQVGVFAFIKKFVNVNGQVINNDGFSAKQELAQDYSIGDIDTLSKLFETIKSLISSNGTNDDVVLNFTGDRITVGEQSYTFDDNAEFQEMSTNSSYGSITQKMKPTNRAKVSLASNWKNQRGIAGKIVAGENGYAEIKNAKTADQVLEIIIQQQGLTFTDDAQKTQLKNLLIKYNPSMFNSDGTVWVNADWSKLDFPTGTDVASMLPSDTQSITADIHAPSVQATAAERLAVDVANNIYLQNGEANVDILGISNDDIIDILDAYTTRSNGKTIIADLKEKANNPLIDSQTARLNAARISMNVLRKLVQKAETIGLGSPLNMYQCPEYVAATRIISSYSDVNPNATEYISSPGSPVAKANVLALSTQYIYHTNPLNRDNIDYDAWINGVDDAVTKLAAAIKTKEAQPT